MNIKVTQKMIDKGLQCFSKKCPIALAFTDKGFDVIVDLDTVEFNSKRDSKEIPLNKKIQKFISNFDSGRKVKPFSFVIPDKYKAYIKGKR